MEYDSVLDQQSISDKSVSLILCVEALLYEIRSYICRGGKKLMSKLCADVSYNKCFSRKWVDRFLGLCDCLSYKQAQHLLFSTQKEQYLD